MNRLRLWLAIMGAAQTIVGGLGVLQLLPDKMVGLLALVVAGGAYKTVLAKPAGLHVGTALYVTPSPMLPEPIPVAAQVTVAAVSGPPPTEVTKPPV